MVGSGEMRKHLMHGISTESRSRRRDSTSNQVEHLMLNERKKASAMLVVGAFFGFLGFAFAFLLGFWKFLEPAVSEFHASFPSGYGYFPATVSEMVHNPKDPAGKCFFAFEFIGAMLIFMSWYPWELRNVYIGDSLSVPCCGDLSWSMFRQFVPAMGMMLVACVTSTPIAQATKLDLVCISIHLTGAVMLFAGYGLVEWIALGQLVERCDDEDPILDVEKDRRQLKVRKFCLGGVVFWYLLFCVLTVVTALPLDDYLGPEWGGQDTWEKRVVFEPGLDKKVPVMVLTDTASGVLLALKVASYVSEVFCGLSLIASHMAIWYFCEERGADMQDTLRSVSQEVGHQHHRDDHPSGTN